MAKLTEASFYILITSSIGKERINPMILDENHKTITIPKAEHYSPMRLSCSIMK